MNTEPQTKKANSAECEIYVENAVWIYERSHFWTAEKDIKTWLIIKVIHTTQAVVKLKPEKKKFRPERDLNPVLQRLWVRIPQCDDQSCRYKYKPCSFQPGRELCNKRLSHDIYLSNS